MKSVLFRTLGMLLSMAVMLGVFVGCGTTEEPVEETKPTAVVYDNGNVSTVVEQGSEAELTAVRDGLVKDRELEGFGTVEKMELYENGVRTTSDELVKVKDNKKVYYSGDKKRVVNYTDGYILDIPADWTMDFAVSSARCEYKSNDVPDRVRRRRSPSHLRQHRKRHGGAVPFHRQRRLYAEKPR